MSVISIGIYDAVTPANENNSLEFPAQNVCQQCSLLLPASVQMQS